MGLPRRVFILRVNFTDNTLHGRQVVLPDQLIRLLTAKNGQLCVSDGEGDRATSHGEDMIVGAVLALQKRQAGCPFRYSVYSDGVEVVEVITCWRVPVGVGTEPKAAAIVLMQEEATWITTLGTVWERKWGGSRPLDPKDNAGVKGAFDHVARQQQCRVGEVLILLPHESPDPVVPVKAVPKLIQHAGRLSLRDTGDCLECDQHMTGTILQMVRNLHKKLATKGVESCILTQPGVCGMISQSASEELAERCLARTLPGTWVEVRTELMDQLRSRRERQLRRRRA